MARSIYGFNGGNFEWEEAVTGDYQLGMTGNLKGVMFVVSGMVKTKENYSSLKES